MESKTLLISSLSLLACSLRELFGETAHKKARIFEPLDSKQLGLLEFKIHLYLVISIWCGGVEALKLLLQEMKGILFLMK